MAVAENEADVAGAPAPLLGRARELAELEVALAAAARRSGALCLVHGEAGIGKTRLCEELAARAAERGFSVYWGRCHELAGAPAFRPWSQILCAWAAGRGSEQLAAELGANAAAIAQIAPELRPRLQALPAEPELDPEQARFRLFDAASSFLRSAATRAPLLLVLDDLHWADSASLRLLSFVARELGSARVLVVGTYRGERDSETRAAELLRRIASDSATRSLPLAGLGPTELAHWIEETSGTPPTEALLDEVQRQTAGNPFLVGLLVHWLASEGLLAPNTASDRVVPREVRGVVAARLDQLPDATRDLLRAAAVIGVEFDAALLEWVSGIQRAKLFDLLGPALDARLLLASPAGAGWFGFAHALLRDALHDGLEPTRRIALHRRVAEAYEELHARDLDAHMRALAHHWLAAAGAGDARKAVDYSVRAAERAAERGAWEEAALHYRNALRALAAEPCDARERFELLLSLGDAELLAGDRSAARAVLRDAAEDARALADASALARVAIASGKGWTWGAGAGADDPELRVLLEDALRALGEGEPRLRSLLLSRLAVARFWSGSRELSAGAVELADAALAVARDSGDERTELVARAARHWVDSIWHDRDAQLARGEALQTLAERCGDAGMRLLAHAFRVVDLLETGDLAGVERHTEAYARLAEELRHPANLWFARGFRALRASLHGDFAGAERALAEAAELARRARSAVAAGALGAAWFGLRLAQGRLAEVEALARAALAGIADERRAFAWRCGLAFVLAELGRSAEARALLDELARGSFADLPRDTDHRIALGLLARVCHRLGDATRAAAVRELLLPLADRRAVTAFGLYCAGSLEGPLGLAEATLGDLDHAVSHLERALESNRALGSGPLAHDAAVDLAEVLLERKAPGDVERARALAEQAAAAASRLGAARTLERARALLAPATSAARTSAPMPTQEGVLRSEGEYWMLDFDGRELRLRDLVGVRYLARLLAEPGRELLALDLAQATAGAPLRGGADDTGALVDARARRAYEERLARLRDELDDAEKVADPARAESARAELDALGEQLAAAFGLRGRARRAGGDSERARLAVTQRIKGVIAKLERLHPALARHLSLHVRTGHYCVYRPDPDRPLRWRVSDAAATGGA